MLVSSHFLCGFGNSRPFPVRSPFLFNFDFFCATCFLIACIYLYNLLYYYSIMEPKSTAAAVKTVHIISFSKF